MPYAPLTRNRTENLQSCIQELRHTADILQAVLDAEYSQSDAAKALGLTPQTMSREAAADMRCYIKSKVLSIDGLCLALEAMRSPSDRLIMDIFGIHPEHMKDCYLYLPEYSEEKLWDAVDDILTKREAFITSGVNGYPQGQCRTYESIGQELGLTRSRIRDIYKKCLRKLRSPHVIQKIFPAVTPLVDDGLQMIELSVRKAMERYRLTAEKYTRMQELSKKSKALEQCIAILQNAFQITADNTESITYAIQKEQEEPVDINQTLRNDPDCSTRTCNALIRAGYKTLNELSGKNISELLNIPNLGQKSYNELIMLMQKYGL